VVCRTLLARSVVVSQAVLVAACNSSPSSPAAPSASAPASNGPTVLSVIATGSAPPVGTSAQFTATANLSGGSTQNVSALATWQSSNTVVAGVNTTGLVTGMAAGDEDITATYLGIIGRAHITIIRPLYTVSGRVTDGTSGGVLPNIHLAIGDGTNAGRTATTRTVRCTTANSRSINSARRALKAI
jgi:Bacterial Ig-like domain (group 2)